MQWAGSLTGWCALRQPLRLKIPLKPSLTPLTTLRKPEAAAFGRRVQT